MIGIPLKLVKTVNGNTIEGVLIKSDNVGNPIEVYTYQQTSLIPHSHNPNIYFDGNFALYDSRKYSSKGNLIESVARKRPPITYIWGYNHSYPIATVLNATKSQVESVIGSLETVGNLYNEGDIQNIGNSLRANLPNAQVTSGVLASGIGLKKLTVPNDLKNAYQYDTINRLITIRDNQDNITDKFSYRYADSSPSGCTAPSPPTISVGSSALCSVTLNASGCAGVINWSNGALGNSISVNTKETVLYSATCSVSTCTSTSSNQVQIPVLPDASWSVAQIGTPAMPYCVQENSGTWTISGTGNTFGTADNLSFPHVSASGNTIMVAKLNTMSANSNGMRSGIMIRANNISTADYYQFFFDSGYQVLSLYEQNSSNGDLQLGFQASSLSVWLRLKKEGNTISAWYSQAANPAWNNDADWTLYTNASNTSFNGVNRFGLVVYNNGYSSNALTNQSVFTNVSINNF